MRCVVQKRLNDSDEGVYMRTYLKILHVFYAQRMAEEVDGSIHRSWKIGWKTHGQPAETAHGLSPRTSFSRNCFLCSMHTFKSSCRSCRHSGLPGTPQPKPLENRNQVAAFPSPHVTVPCTRGRSHDTAPWTCPLPAGQIPSLPTMTMTITSTIFLTVSACRWKMSHI